MYSYDKIRATVQYLKRKYNTDNPFEIADGMDIVVIKQPLGNIWGLYKYIKRSKVIFINAELECIQQKLVCGHELGHAVLHPRENCPFLKVYTLFSVNRLELEASLFAAYLLQSSTDDGFFTYEQLIAMLKIVEGASLYEAACTKEV